MIINTALSTTQYLQINLNERLLNELSVVEQFNIHELVEIGLNNHFEKLKKYGFCTILSNRINENLIGIYQIKTVHIQKYQLEKLDGWIYNLNKSDSIKVYMRHIIHLALLELNNIEVLETTLENMYNDTLKIREENNKVDMEFTKQCI